MSILSKIFGRVEVDSLERETAVLASQRDAQRDREEKLVALRGHIGDTDPGYPDAVERRRQQLGR
jgi:hypothetical protein